MISVKIKWSGSEYPLEQIPLSTTVKELKELIKEHTGVLPVRQKLCGISLKGKVSVLVICNVCRSGLNWSECNAQCAVMFCDCGIN